MTETSRLRIVKAKDASGRNAFYILNIFPSRLEEYEQDLQNGKISSLDYYGIIKDSAYGEDMPKRIEIKFERLLNEESLSKIVPS